MSKEYIPEVTVENIDELSMVDVLRGIKPYCLEPVPEGIIDHPDGVKIVDRLIGRFANLYAYLMFLYGHLNSESNRLKLIGDDMGYSISVKKKDSIFEIARAVRYKQEACSRMLTALLREADDDEVFDQPNHGNRMKKEQDRRRVSGWNAVATGQK